jgi:hypothetical protein
MGGDEMGDGHVTHRPAVEFETVFGRLSTLISCPICGKAPGWPCGNNLTHRERAANAIEYATALLNRCPRCKAKPGEACRTPAGAWQMEPHAGRKP